MSDIDPSAAAVDVAIAKEPWHKALLLSTPGHPPAPLGLARAALYVFQLSRRGPGSHDTSIPIPSANLLPGAMKSELFVLAELALTFFQHFAPPRVRVGMLVDDIIR